MCCSFSILSYGSSCYSPLHVFPDAHRPAVLVVGSLRWEAARHERDSFVCSSCLWLCTIAMSLWREGLVAWSVYSCVLGCFSDRLHPVSLVCLKTICSLYCRSALLLQHCGSYIYGHSFEGPTAEYEHRQSRRRAVLLSDALCTASHDWCQRMHVHDNEGRQTRLTRAASLKPNNKRHEV